jgi:hypothetical protein
MARACTRVVACDSISRRIRSTSSAIFAKDLLMPF